MKSWVQWYLPLVVLSKFVLMVSFHFLPEVPWMIRPHKALFENETWMNASEQCWHNAVLCIGIPGGLWQASITSVKKSQPRFLILPLLLSILSSRKMRLQLHWDIPCWRQLCYSLPLVILQMGWDRCWKHNWERQMAGACGVKHPCFLEPSVFRGKQNSASSVEWKQFFHLRFAFLQNSIFILEGQIYQCIWQAQAAAAEGVLSEKITSLKLTWWTFQLGCERFRSRQATTAWLKM